MGVIMKGFIEVCFDMIEWHHVNKGHGLVISTTTSIAFNEHYLTSITAMAKPIIVVNIVHLPLLRFIGLPLLRHFFVKQPLSWM